MRQKNKDEYLFTEEEIKLIQKCTNSKIRNRKIHKREKPIEIYSGRDKLLQALWDMDIY